MTKDGQTKSIMLPLVHACEVRVISTIMNQGSIYDSKFGGEAIIDNVVVGVDVGVACAPYCAKCKNWQFMI